MFCLFNRRDNSDMPRLQDMPKAVMNEILSNCDFIAVCQLAKTSRYFRNFIGNSDLDHCFDRLEIVADLTTIRITLGLANSRTIDIYYENHNGKCAVHSPLTTRTCYLGREDIAKLASHDLSRMLNMKTVMKRLEVYFYLNCSRTPLGIESVEEYEKEVLKEGEKRIREVWDTLKECLLFRDSPLQVAHFKMDLIEDTHPQDVLSLLDQDSLLKINLVGDSHLSEWDIKQMVKMEAWKQLEEFTHIECVFKISLHQFLHIPIVVIERKSVTKKEIKMLKKAFNYHSKIGKSIRILLPVNYNKSLLIQEFNLEPLEPESEEEEEEHTNTQYSQVEEKNEGVLVVRLTNYLELANETSDEEDEE
uniref:F-box domain-containing protein n=3 Tax=Caenorhabditis tropicalis TaxID=1561998 RepID=A0A1I7UPA2_9PELO